MRKRLSLFFSAAGFLQHLLDLGATLRGEFNGILVLAATPGPRQRSDGAADHLELGDQMSTRRTDELVNAQCNALTRLEIAIERIGSELRRATAIDVPDRELRSMFHDWLPSVTLLPPRTSALPSPSEFSSTAN